MSVLSRHPAPETDPARATMPRRPARCAGARASADPARPWRWQWLRAGLVGLVAGVAVAGASATATCGPSPAGSPCGTASATSVPGGRSMPPLAGNPVNLASGNKLLTEVDLPPLPGPLGLEIVRHHNSVHAQPHVPPTAIGRGWRLSYDLELAVIGPTVQVLTADGRRLMFRRDADDPATCVAEDPAHGRLVGRRTAAGERFDWHLPDGRRFAFDAQGRLVQVRAPSGDVLELQRDAAGRLVRATDPAGRSLVFGWSAPGGAGFQGIAWIDSPVGRFAFRHGGADGASLLAVVRPAADGTTVERRYHHEDPRFPTLLTGVGVHGPDGFGGTVTRRLATYRYGDDGRAVETALGEPSAPVHRLAIDRSRPGETRLTDAEGRVTVVRHATLGGQVVLTGTRGPGCTGCPPSPMDVVHDAQGRVVAEVALDAAGRPWRSRLVRHDAQGRPVEVRLVEHVAGPGGGTADVEVAVERLSYAGDGPDPERIERTGVVEGRPMAIAWERDARGRVVRQVETGYSPVDAAGRPLPTGLDGRVPAAHAAAATPLRRETRYVHADVGGRSRLVAIDGPLPNGPAGTPADSDVTRLHWDERGDRLVRIERPGGEVTDLVHDAAGRLVGLQGAQGVTRWTLDPASGRVVEVARTPPGSGEATEVVRWRLDATGRPVEQVAGWRTADGWRADADARQWRAGWDGAGRPSWRVDALGGAVRWRHDAQGRLVEAAWARGRLGGVHRVDAEVPDAFAPGAGGDAGPEVDRQAVRGAPRLRWLHDDFGRVVARLSADHGDRVDRHDEADRLVARRDADGVEWHWTWDLQGRPLVRTVTAPGRADTTTRWTWDGPRLVAVDDPVQRERWRHDAAGRPIERRVSVTAGEGAGAAPAVHAVQRWRYDERGRIAGWTLADGTWLRVSRNGQGQVVALHRERLETRWLQRLLPDQTLVAGLERDGVGPSRTVHGNGLVAQRLRVGDGTLVRTWLAPAPRPVPPGAPTADGDRIAALLGLGPARASAGPVVSPAADGPASTGPGWLGRPAEPGARLDERYLWDERGNLVWRESRGEAGGRDRAYLHDERDQLLQVLTRRAGDATPVAVERFAYDEHMNRRLVQHGPSASGAGVAAPAVRRLTVEPASHRLRRIDATDPARPGTGDWRHDPAGRVIAAGDRRFGWDMDGRLATVHEGDRRLVRQVFNHLGERVVREGSDGRWIHLHDDRRRWADVDADGRVHRHWVWLADLPVAVIDPAAPVDAAEPADGSALVRDLRRLWRAATGEAERLAHLHTDHLGAPVLATAPDGRTLWQASYDAFGRAHVTPVEPGFALDLRLPGQHEDPDTGLHHNDHRTYDPDTGRYLSPDPLGAPDGPNPYVYVRNAPLRHVDPSGLILFAFDGTGASPGTASNVWHFAQAYDDLSAYDRAMGYTGTSFYVQGPGADGNRIDQAVATSLTSTIQHQMSRFQDYVQGNVAWHRQRAGAAGPGRLRITLDVVGYSRGAAMAREFSHRVADFRQSSHFRDQYGDCVTILQRLLALFDTVLSHHTAALSAARPRMAVPPEVQVAVQAVAMNEHRPAFAVESIVASPGHLTAADPRRIERGFIGAHADIGGDHAEGGLNGAGRPDLSDLPLMWVVQQARQAGVAMRPLPPELRRVTAPVVHDMRRGALWRSTGHPLPEAASTPIGRLLLTGPLASNDRVVRFHRPGETVDPAAHPAPASPEEQAPASTRPATRSERPQEAVRWAAGMSSSTARRFVVRTAPVRLTDERVGTVDLCAYLAWLRTHYGMVIEPHAGCA